MLQLLKKKTLVEEKLESYSSDATFEVVEAYNSLVTNLIHLPIDNKCKMIAITSSGYGEGKSSVAINLASALAANLVDKKVLLVDSDFRCSKVYEFMKGSDAKKVKGVADYLDDDKTALNILNSNVSNLDVVYAGKTKSNPTALIRSEKMREVLKSFEDKYDYVIIDTPPVNVYSDTLFLADRVSGFIISTKRNISSVSEIEKLTDRINSAGSEVLGFVYSE